MPLLHPFVCLAVVVIVVVSRPYNWVGLLVASLPLDSSQGGGFLISSNLKGSFLCLEMEFLLASL